MSPGDESWTKDEDLLLERAVNVYGVHKWGAISNLLTGRLPRECHDRWFHNLQCKQHSSTDISDTELLKLHELLGDAWDLIGNRAGLPPVVCKRRVYQLLDLDSLSDDPQTPGTSTNTARASSLSEDMLVQSIPHKASAVQGYCTQREQMHASTKYKDIATTRQKDHCSYLKSRPAKQKSRPGTGHKEKVERGKPASYREQYMNNTENTYKLYITEFSRRNRILPKVRKSEDMYACRATGKLKIPWGPIQWKPQDRPERLSSLYFIYAQIKQYTANKS